MAKEALSIIDQRTQAAYEIPIHDGTIRAMDLRKIKTGPDDFGLMTYDPAFMNTASCRSAITFIDGDKGILRYRGYPIEQLAEKCTFLEVAYLLLFGELPTEAQLKEWVTEITHHTMIHETTKKFLEGFRYERPPHGDAGQHGGGALHRLSRSRATSSIRRCASCRSCASSARCPPSPPTPTAIAWASPTSIPTTTSATPRTS